MDLAALVTAFVVAVLPVAPTEPTLVGLGALASVAHVSPLAIILVAGLGCSISDHMFYAAGRWGGPRLLGLLSRWGAADRMTTWLVARAQSCGGPVFIGARWLPAGGSAGAAVAGTVGWSLRRFTPTSLVGSMLWSSYAALLGYLGSSFTGNPLAGLGISLLVMAAVALGGRPLMHRHRRGAAVPADIAVLPSAAAEPILAAA
ncbi:MAG: VTT domain-containing protein [Nocardia sp.]|nr:VTT domain-containing protein [Nocardia sp.]